MDKLTTIRIIYTVLISILLVGCVNEEDVRAVNIDDIKLSIPDKYIGKSGLMSDLSKILDLDNDSNSIIVRIPSKEVQGVLPNYVVNPTKQFKDDLELLITALKPNEIDNHSNPEEFRTLKDLWYAKNSYKDRIVKADETAGWFRIYRNTEYPNSFAVVNSDTSDDMPKYVKDFWIAHCLMMGSKSERNARCTSFTLLNNILVEYHVSKQNLQYIEQLNSFIEDKINSWM